MKITIFTRTLAAVIALSTSTLALAGQTPWLDRDNPGGTGDWENTAALITKVECNFIATGQSTAGTAGYTCDVNGSICKNSAAVACKDTNVRYTFDDKRGNTHVTSWLDRDDPSGQGDWETTVDLLKVECKFTKNNAAVVTGGAYICSSPNVINGGIGKNASNGGVPVDNIAVRYTY